MTQHIGPKTKAADDLHGMKYRGRNEDFREAMNRNAFGLKDDDAHYHVLRDILLDQRFLPGGRIQGAIGATRQTTAFNCFVSGTIMDSFVDGPGSIMHRAHEAAATMRMGGGIGYDFSTIRPRGALIRKLQSQATGPVNFMRIFNEVCLCTASSGHRRGAQMGVLRVDHPDIEEFILAKQNADKLTGFNVSIAVTDEFMEAALSGKEFDLKFGGEVHRTVDAAELWERIMRSTYDFAEPGVIYIDRVNKMNNLSYTETIAATNPCFTGDTLVWTSEGHRTFRELADSGADVQVLSTDDDGRFVHRTMRRPRLTRRNAKLVEVTLTRPNGSKKSFDSVVRCTPSHEFYMRDGRKVKAKDLKSGDRIHSVYRTPRGEGYVGLNSHVCNMMEHHVPFEDVEGLGATVDAHHIDEDKTNNVPSNLELKDHAEHSRSHKLGDDNPMRKHPELNHFNWRDNVGKNNGRYRDDINDGVLRDMRGSGLSYAAIAGAVGCSEYTVMKRLGWVRPENHIVKNVRTITVREDVYCGTVDETHKFFIATGPDEGVLVQNCGEQPLPPYGACLLGSFNLVKYLRHQGPIVVVKDNQVSGYAQQYDFDMDRFMEDIPPIVRAMDNVTDRTRYPLAEQRGEAMTKRRMGLGVTGLANAAEACGHPYGSSGFIEFEVKILDALTQTSYMASAMLAKESNKGPFPLFDHDRFMAGEFVKILRDDVKDAIKRHGLRNSHLTSIAPTGTISMCADNVSSSIEPVFSYETERPINTPEGPSIAKVQDYGVSELKVRGKLAKDVTAQEHVAVLTAAQRYVDSAVSKTCNMDGRVMSWDEFKGLYRSAWEGGAKGCTTFNISGHRMALLKESTDEGAACKVDPETGVRECA